MSPVKGKRKIFFGAKENPLRGGLERTFNQGLLQDAYFVCIKYASTFVYGARHERSF